MRLIKRNTYLNRLIDIIGTHDIKVISGIRRSGKSKLLFMFSEYLKKDSLNNIIEINLQLKQNEELLNKDNIYIYISNRYIQNKIIFF